MAVAFGYVRQFGGSRYGFARGLGFEGGVVQSSRFRSRLESLSTAAPCRPRASCHGPDLCEASSSKRNESMCNFSEIIDPRIWPFSYSLSPDDTEVLYDTCMYISYQGIRILLHVIVPVTWVCDLSRHLTLHKSLTGAPMLRSQTRSGDSSLT